MSNINKRTAACVTAGIIVFCLLSCAGEDPKSLAKQTYSLGLEIIGAFINPSKAAELEKKAEELTKKVEKLSAGDKTVYNEELKKLTGEGFSGLLDAGSILNASQDALKSTRQIHDALNSINAESAARQASELINNLDIQKAADAAQKALNALSSFGF